MTREGSLFDVPPAAIGRFRVLHQIGAGTSGPVFRAVDPDVDRPLAIKLFTINLAPERSGELADALNGLVTGTPPLASAATPVAAGLHGPTPFLATQWAGGDSLDVALKQFGPAALDDLVPRLRALAGVLDVAAGRDVLHGALHPRDLMVSESETMLTGLGVWPILVRHGVRLPHRRPYRAPELGDGAVSAVGDQFSLAALAYEWMTGRRAPSAFVSGDMVPVGGVDRDALGMVFAVALHADPGVRYASCDDFVAALAEVAADAVPAEPLVDSRSRRRSRPGAAVPTLPLDEVPAGVDDASELPRAPAPESAAVDTTWPEPPVQAAENADEDDALHVAPEAPEPQAWSESNGEAADLSFKYPEWATADFRSREMPAPIARRAAPWAATVIAGLVAGLGLGYVIWGRSPASPLPTEAAAPIASPEPPRAPVLPEASPPTAAPAAVPASGSGARPGAGEPAPASGSLLVRSVPAGATVFVDDERRGVTPLTLQRVEFGTRRVRIQRDGFGTEERQVALTRGRPSRSVDVRLTRAAPRPAAASPSAAPAPTAPKTGTLLVESRPAGATVLLDGRPVGTTPATIADLAPGSYTVQMQLVGFRPIRTTVRVVAGETARAAASLTGVQEQQ